MPRLALTAAVITAVLAGCAGSAAEPQLALVATADPLAPAHPLASPPTPAPAPPPPPTPDPAAARLAAARPEAARASRNARRTARPATAAVGGDIWGALARCESGGNPRAVGGGGR